MDPSPPGPPRAETSRAVPPSGTLTSVVLALKEALLGMPQTSAPEAEDLRAQIERLEGLVRRAAAKEADLDQKRLQIEQNWQRFSQEVYPKLVRRLAASGLDGLFDVHALLVDSLKEMTARTEEAYSESRLRHTIMAESELRRLQGEVVRLLEGRRRLLRGYSEMKSRLNKILEKDERLQDLWRQGTGEPALLMTELEKAREEAKARTESLQRLEADFKRLLSERSAFQVEASRARREAGARSTESERLRAESKQSAEERAQLTVELGRLRSDAEARRAELERLRLESERQTEERARLQAELDAARETAENRGSEVERVREASMRVAEERALLQAELGQAQRAREEAAAEAARVRGDFKQVSEVRARLRAELGEAVRSDELHAAEAERLRGEQKQALEEAVRLKAELESAILVERRRAGEVERLKGEVRDLTVERARLQGMLKGASQAAEAQTRAVERLELERVRVEDEALLTEQTLGAIKEDLQRTESDRARLAEEARRAGSLESALKKAEETKESFAAEAKKALTEAERAKAEAERVRGEASHVKDEAAHAREELEALRKEAEALRASLQAGPPSGKPASPGAAAPASAPAAPSEALAKGLDSVFTRLAAVVGQARKLSQVRPQEAAPAWPILTARLAHVQDQLKSVSELASVPGPSEGLAVAPLVEAVLRRWESPLKRHGVTIVRRLDPAAPKARVNAERLRVALFQLVANAYEGLPKGGILTASLTSDAASGTAVLKLSDTGKGFPPAVLADPFTPFTHARAGHLGLGLALAHHLLQGFGADLKVSNEGGACLVVRFAPAAPGPSSPA